MIRLFRTDSGNKDFIRLVKELDADLAERDGEEHSFYSQFNKVDMIRHVVVAYQNNIAISCGAIKEYDPKTMEVKRMFTIPENRGKGFAGIILHELENWASEMNFEKCILETGKRQAEAIGLYKKSGYDIIPNYGQYAGIDNSICFMKKLN
ncbi:MAG: GNAT family N-acetyltransferase [Sphingobacteriales bacterium 17-39-43]|uniref:GNAT family N-acetyltransferase n=1 Tax=Daejeonella sp. TaxID=2805397 RepID=UPI000BD6A14C|nr:GNAT family N-acetyltransferase [Daejeonella sp.]OYY03128.1 MAG: GNAT family N-acetyltransferase [Sphingobacteriia bacterium 35-40-5]OYZ31193.1 MAG: GNAT family N-acetyltransferase [Sphingobacteriales bacterium 16-39-50]OZA24072.1 MAG: GNAT family N-acetyltransferase [Sphingobacteriales bacterium 17-39-43]HQT23245.1 GNAT family N-acetyltransferase [Daejeonella sp.]HQT58197.1 GNAT family N-acetyltransferase [Daejeonella sp.]